MGFIRAAQEQDGFMDLPKGRITQIPILITASLIAALLLISWITSTPAYASAPAQGNEPTDTPVPPTATPIPPTPSSIQSAFRVGPTVRLRPVNDVIDRDQDGIVELLFRNPNLNETAMVVDMSISVPSGFHLYGEGFATDIAAGTASGLFEVAPGQSRTIFLNVKAEKIGRSPIHFSGSYWPKGNKDLYNPVSLNHSFAVNQASPNPLNAAATNPNQTAGSAGTGAAAPAAAPSGQSDDGSPSASCSLSPEGSSGNGAGDMALLGLPLLGLAGLAGLRRSRRGS